MEAPLRYRPIKAGKPVCELVDKPEIFDYGFLDHDTCKKLYLAGRIDDSWDIEIYIPEQDKIMTTTEKPSVLWNKK